MGQRLMPTATTMTPVMTSECIETYMLLISSFLGKAVVPERVATLGANDKVNNHSKYRQHHESELHSLRPHVAFDLLGFFVKHHQQIQQLSRLVH